MSVIDRALSAFRDVMLLREQMKDLRGDVAGLSGDVAGLVGDIRDLEQRVARLEGVSDTMRLLAARPARLPEE